MIVGAQKCGTTTLAAVLDEHPGICLAAGKEAHLFDRADVQHSGPSTDDLERCFPHREPGQLLLDATPSYLYLPGCLEAAAGHNPNLRAIVMLRPPGDRAVSHYGHACRLGFEQRHGLLALSLERRRLRADNDPLAQGSSHRERSYLDRGRYHVQLQRLLALVPRVHVVLMSDLIADPERVVHGVHDFLGVERHPVDALPRLNVGDGRRRPALRAVAGALTRRDTARTEVLLGLPRGALR